MFPSRIWILGPGLTLLMASSAWAQLKTGDVVPYVLIDQLEPGNSLSRQLIESPGASFLRIHFAHMDLGKGDRVEVLDRDGVLVQRYADEPRQDLWTFLVRGDRAVLVLRSERPDRGSGYAVDQIVRGLPGAPDAACDPFCGWNIECVNPSPEYNNRTPVCHFHFMVGAQSFVGTGWLIGSYDCMITNYHNVQGAAINSMLAEFNYECSQCVGGWVNVQDNYLVDAILKEDCLLDYALLDLSGAPALVWGFLSVNRQPPTVGDAMYTIGMPGGWPKSISYGNYTGFLDPPNTCVPVPFCPTTWEVAYSSQQWKGSSGSPVFDLDTHLVEALHHCGDPAGCGAGTGIPMSIIIPQIEPELIAHGCTYNFVDCGLVYCVAKMNSLGCIPAIDRIGCPSATAGSGFNVTCAMVRNNKSGLLFYGNSGQNAAPFQGGTLCVKSPIKRTPTLSSGGTPAPANDCSGTYSIDMNAFAVGVLGGTPATYLTVPGTVVDCQWWGRDQGFPAPNNTTLSDALEYEVGP